MKNIFTVKNIGYFNDENQMEPAFNPSINESICPFCGESLAKDGVPLKTISFLKESSPKSYFYRCHKNCYEENDQKVNYVEGFLVEIAI